MGTKWPKGIRPHGNKIQIRVYRHGEEISETVEGSVHNARDLASAINRREEMVARIKVGLPLFTGDESKLTLFKDAAQDYMNDLEAAYSTHFNYEYAINKYWIPAFAKWPVTDITTKSIKAVLRKYNHSVATKRMILTPLRGILDSAEVNPNPVAAIRLREKRGDEVTRYRPHERQELLGKLSGQPRVFFSVMFGCGLRPGEALALQWKNYNGETLRVTQTISKRQLKESTKTYHSREVYVPSWVRPVLNDHYTRPRKGWVFLTRFNKPYHSPEILNDAWREAHKKAGIAYRVPYVCRHTRASELLSQGIPAAEAAQQLGHSLKTFITTYAEWIEEFSQQKDLSRFEGIQVDTSDWKQDTDRTEGESQKSKVLKFKGKAGES